MEWILEHEPMVRLTAFVGVFALMALWELLEPRRQLRAAKGRRWFANLGLLIVDAALLRLIGPLSALALAVVAEQRGWGLLHHTALPWGVRLVLAVILLDLAIYLQHVVFHAVPTLWRLHMVHHADVDIDVTTGTRFHPLEIVLSMAYKMAVVAALGPPVVAVVTFEVLLNATSMFNHSNVVLPARIDRVLRWLVVTPDMHRVHHSVERAETDSNFGFNLPWWDRLLGTYKDQPAAGHQAMSIGLANLQAVTDQSLGWLLGLPFTGRARTDPGAKRTSRENPPYPQ